MLGQGQLWILFEDLLGVIAGVGHQLLIFGEVGDFEVEHAALACALQVAGAAQLQVKVSDLEAVVGLHHCVQTLAALR